MSNHTILFLSGKTILNSYLDEMKEKLNGHDPLVEARRFRYSYYNPQGEAYISLIVEYKNGNVWLHRYKFNNNLFVGERVDHTITCNPDNQTIREELRKDAYKRGTGIRQYIELI